MATVRASKQFFTDLTEYVNKMRDAEVNSLKLPDTPDEVQFGRRSAMVEHLVWGEHKHLMDKLPVTWTSCKNQVDLQIGSTDEEESGVRIGVRFKCNGTIFPPNHNGFYSPDVDVSHRFIMDADNMHYPEVALVRPIYQNELRKEQVRRKWAKTLSDVKNFFHAQPSVNAALKIYSALRLYVPKKYLIEVDREVERKANRATLQLDESALAAQAVEARLLQSGA